MPCWAWRWRRGSWAWNRRDARPRRDAQRDGDRSGLAAVDLGSGQMVEAVPSDVEARELEQEIAGGGGAFAGGRSFRQVEDVFVGVGGVKEERLAEHDALAVPHQTPLEQGARLGAGGAATLGDLEARAAQQIVHLHLVAADGEDLEQAT